ncbi:MAG: RidA family protein [Pseudomonadota bacterium]|jgi:enamine deaminase RidA (YjgF/YER057c/UK114 family)|nr:RidA family protein [Pseudomonadota bacterium]MEC8821345.1 RidA family protein [Pseudomonadota bacterium]
MKKKLLILAIFTLWLSGSAFADVIRHPLPNNSTFPIASAVEVPAGTTITFHSGTVPGTADKTAKPGTPAFYGDTKTQTISVFERIKQNLKSQGMNMGNIIKLTVFLVGDPAKDNAMDFAGFMEAYVQYFGTKEQPNLPARSAVQIAGLVRPLMFVEIEAITAR